MRARLLLGTLVVLGSFLFAPTATANAADDVDRAEILQEINDVRAEHGLSPYELDENFCEFAQIRAREQEERCSHTRPNGEEWYTVSPLVYRENIAYIRSHEEEDYLLEAWMESPGHRANVLSDDSTVIGIGIFETEKEGECYVVTLTD
jgi:uncharacterized protein YkwD